MTRARPPKSVRTEDQQREDREREALKRVQQEIQRRDAKPSENHD